MQPASLSNKKAELFIIRNKPWSAACLHINLHHRKLTCFMSSQDLPSLQTSIIRLSFVRDYKLTQNGLTLWSPSRIGNRDTGQLEQTSELRRLAITESVTQDARCLFRWPNVRASNQRKKNINVLDGVRQVVHMIDHIRYRFQFELFKPSECDRVIRGNFVEKALQYGYYPFRSGQCLNQKTHIVISAICTCQ